jgi:hypothetical protein
MQRSKLVLGCVITLAVVGLGAAAVAMESDTGGAGSLEGTTTTTVVPSTTTSTTTSTTAAPTTTVAPVADPATTTGDVSGNLAGDGGVERSTDGCDGGTYTNHGDYVSSIAHDPDRQPGDVAAAAQSDCGKPVASAGGDSTEAPETEAPDSGSTGAPSGSGNGHGNAYGHSR